MLLVWQLEGSCTCQYRTAETSSTRRKARNTVTPKDVPGNKQVAVSGRLSSRQKRIGRHLNCQGQTYVIISGATLFWPTSTH